MSPLTLSSSPETLQIADDGPAGFDDAMGELRQAIDGYRQQPNQRETRNCLIAARRRAWRAVSALSKRADSNRAGEHVLGVVRELAKIEMDLPAGDAEEAAWLRGLDQPDWPDLLSAMILTPAWRWAKAPRLSAVPDWLWGDYAEWLFAAPRSFLKAGEADVFAAHFGAHVEELSRWVERNLGSKTVRVAMESYLRVTQLMPLTPSQNSLKQHAHAHARILAASIGAARMPSKKPTSRNGRRLRVGFIGSHAAAIPSWGRLLDSDRFEVSLHAFDGVEDAGEGSDAAISAILSLLQVDNKTQKFQALPANLQEQLARFEELALDVAFFAEDLALATSSLAQLAAARVAPLQIALAPAVATTGVADVFAVPADSFSAEIAKQFTERVAVVPLGGHVFEELAGVEANAAAARAALGLSSDAFVAVTAARLSEITGDVMARWIRLLCRVPGSVLAIQLLQAADTSAAEIEQLGNVWDAQLKAAGIAPERGLILAGAVNSLPQLQAAMIAGNLFLDAGAFGEPDLLHVPLALGLPVITQEGKSLRARSGTALLRSLGLNDLVAGDDAHLEELFELLATDSAARAAVVERIRAAVGRRPLCRDGLAAAEVFGALAERAYEELLTMGARKFREAPPLGGTMGADDVEAALSAGAAALVDGDARTALRKARDVLEISPRDPRARLLAGRAYMTASRWASAIDYLLAAVETVDDAGAWFDLAVALNRNERRPEAIQALEASLRLDAKRADAWVMLIEFAKAAGAGEMMRDALGALRDCAPNDPRLPELTAAVGHAA